MEKDLIVNKEAGFVSAFLDLVERRPLLVVTLLVFFLDFLVYSQSLFFEFQWDDRAMIEENPSIRHLFGMWPPSGARYVGMLTFAFNYSIGGLDPFSYHLFNVIVHGINGVLVWQLARYVLKTQAFSSAVADDKRSAVIPLLAAVIFVVHPVNTQAVAYVSQRFASLATMFYVLSVVLYLRARLTSESGDANGSFSKATAYYVSAIIVSVLAMKTKEISFTLPATLFLCEAMLFSRSSLGGKRLFFLMPFVISALIVPLSVVGLGAASASGVLSDLSSATAETSIISRGDYLLTQFRVITTYIRLFFVPLAQNVDYDYPIYTSFFSAPVLISFLFIAAILSGAVYLYVRSVRRHFTEGLAISFGMLWFFAALSVESSVIPIKDVIFEHRMYLPLCGASIAASTGIFLAVRRITPGRAAANVLKVSVILCFAFGTLAFLRVGVWKNPVTLWSDAVAKSPDKARVYNNLGDSYNTVERYDESIVVLKKAIALKPEYVQAHDNLGVAYAAKGMYKEAITEHRASIDKDPSYYVGYVNMAKVYQKLDRYDEAIIVYNVALKIKPDNHVALDSLGTLYFQLGLFDKAVKEFRAATRLKPDYVNARINLAQAYLVLGDIDSALEQYEILKALRYKDPDLHYNLAVAYSMKGRIKDAIREFENVLKENPKDEEVKRRIEELRLSL